MKKLGVEFLVELLNNFNENFEFAFKEEIEQAKEMQKQNIIDARLTAPTELITYSKTTYLDEAEQYYKETFKTK